MFTYTKFLNKQNPDETIVNMSDEINPILVTRFLGKEWSNIG